VTQEKQNLKLVNIILIAFLVIAFVSAILISAILILTKDTSWYADYIWRFLHP